MAWQHEYDERVRNKLYQQFGYDVGNVYWVIQSTKSFYNRFLESHMFIYPDGSKSVYTDAGTGDGIAAALTACKGGRNDYVIVGTGAYTLTAALTLAGKSSIHLIGTNGGGYDVGGPGAAALIQSGNFEVVIMESYGELTGFQIHNKAGYGAVTAAALKWRPNVHHNYFHMCQGTACSIIKATGDGFSHGNISNNRFQTYVGGNITEAIGINSSNSVLVKNNTIVNYSGTMDCAIKCAGGVQNLIVDNIISDCGGAGTITIGIDAGDPTGNTVVGNRIATLSGRGLAGGTANRSFVQNFDSTAGGATAIET